MMPDLEQIYDAAFFAAWGSGNERYVRSAEEIVEALMRDFAPRRVADVGCGCGVYSWFFSQKGVDVLAIDGVEPPREHRFPVPIQTQDLTAPIAHTWPPFDLTLCLEVAEHIPAPLVDVFLENLTRFGDLLILSAAPPGQGGHHHVNEQPKRYWVRRLAEKGFAYDRRATGRLVAHFQARKLPHMWMGMHISVYRRAGPGTPPRQELPFAVRL